MDEHAAHNYAVLIAAVEYREAVLKYNEAVLVVEDLSSRLRDAEDRRDKAGELRCQRRNTLAEVAVNNG